MGVQIILGHEEIAHQMIRSKDGKWLLVANFKKDMAD